MRSIMLASMLASVVYAGQSGPSPSQPPAQPPAQAAAAKPGEMSQAEQDSLRQALGEAGNSSIDFVRALENHLATFPDSPRKSELERALVKAAAEIRDDDRVIKFGERVLAREPDDAQLLERVATALVRKNDKPDAERALKYAKRLQEILRTAVTDKASSARDEVKLKEGVDRANGRVLILLARANGILEHYTEAADAAELSFSIYPSVEAAREASRWLRASGKQEPAIRYLAKAFTISELKATDSEAAQDRIKLGQLYKEWKGTDTGLGDLILQTYDQTSAVFSARREELRKLDPNSAAKETTQFTLSGVQGDKLALSSLKGKVVVMDFWATWCGPCRIQHPLYEQVKSKYKDRDDVVFLAIDTDEDHSLVKPFLEQNKWNSKVYFDDGLGQFLQVTSIPTTVILNKKGEVASRMNGFLPDRFIEMLSDRIDQARP